MSAAAIMWGMLKYQTIPVTPFAQNCSLIWCDEIKEAAVIDPGGDLDRLMDAVSTLGLNLRHIWLTHAHIDHAGGTGQLARELDLPIIGPHPGDQFWIDALPEQSQMFNFAPAETFQPTRWLNDGDTCRLAPMRFRCVTVLGIRRATWSFTPPKLSARL